MASPYPKWGRACSLSSASAECNLEVLMDEARALGVPVVQGRFGASMDVALVNCGPVTILLDTEKMF